LGKLRQVTRALVPAIDIEKNFLDAGRILPQPASNSVEAEYKAYMGHL
jgi:hypothetical protein